MCSATGEGMNEGWLTDNDDFLYFKYKKDALKWCTDNGYEDLNDAFLQDAIFWTQWDDETDREYIEIDGVLTEIENI
jgi:hypothetical protein